MSATLTWRCDVCDEQTSRDVSDDAGCYCKVNASYPDGWYIGSDRVACDKTACQAEVMSEDGWVPERDGDTLDTLGDSGGDL